MMTRQKKTDKQQQTSSEQVTGNGLTVMRNQQVNQPAQWKLKDRYTTNRKQDHASAKRTKHPLKH